MMAEDFALEMEQDGEEGASASRWAMTLDQLQNLINAEMQNSAGFNRADDDTDTALRYFNAELPRLSEEVPGYKFRSRIVSSDFRDAVHSTVAEIMPTIGGEAPVEFAPVGQDDEAQAEIETEAVNHVVMQICGAYHAFNVAIQDGLIRRLPLIKVYWEETAVPEYDELEKVPLDILERFVDTSDPENPQAIALEEGEEATLLDYGPNEDGETAYLTIRRTKILKHPRIVAVPRDEFAINDDHSSHDYDMARFLDHFRARTVSELTAEGFDPDELSKVTTFDPSGEQSSLYRRRKSHVTNYDPGHEPSRQVLYHEIYINADMDGDGIAERVRVSAAGQVGSVRILDWNFANDQPFVAGYLYAGLYDWQGWGLYEKMKDIQGAKTEIIRQILDFGERSLTQRNAVYPDHWEMDTVLDSMMGGVAIKTNANATMDEITTPDLPRSSEAMLGILNTMRRERGGSAIETSSQAMQVAQDSAHGTERVMSALEQINAMLARNVAESLVKGVYKKAHKLIRMNWEGPLTMKKGGAWINTEPRTKWLPRDDVSIRTGLSQSERLRQAGALGFTIQQQQALLPLGMDGILITPAGIHEAQMDFLRLSGVTRPGQYFTDPSSPEGQQAAQQKQQAQQQAAQQQQEATMAQLRVPIEMERVKGEYNNMREQMKQMAEGQRQQLTAMNDMMKHLDTMRLELAKLNAEYDMQEVPDTVDDLA